MGSSLFWDAGCGATFDVYFATTNPPPVRISVGRYRGLPYLEHGTTDYW